MKYQVVCYMRIDPPDDYVPLPIKDAHAERQQSKLMQPENIYLIEEIDESE